MPITFLVDDAWGGGGVGHTVANVANHLARRHPVRVISFHRGRNRPRFPLDPSIEVSVVRDLRLPESDRHQRLAQRPSRLRPQPSRRHMSRLTDHLLRRALREVRSGMLISTRPSLHLAASAFAPAGVQTVAWEHQNFVQRFHDLRQFTVLSSALPRMSGLVVLTPDDATDYLRELPGMRAEVRVLPNSVTWPVAAEPAPLDSKVIVAAGRLKTVKGYDRMIRAFAPVARDHPDWQLHIYGKGPQRAALKELIRRLGLIDQVLLRGYTKDLRSVLERASAFAMSSRAEGFGMVLVEAMSVGVPLVAFDCPRGPGAIIRDGHNGLLVPDHDVRGYRQALRRLVEDAALRERLGAHALADAHAYTIDAVGAGWEDLVADLTERRRAPAPVR